LCHSPSCSSSIGTTSSVSTSGSGSGSSSSSPTQASLGTLGGLCSMIFSSLFGSVHGNIPRGGDGMGSDGMGINRYQCSRSVSGYSSSFSTQASSGSLGGL
ncbi:unnamed protein product, partial [Coccothraustes coccothraustes]